MTYFDVYRPFVELLCTSHPTQQQVLLNSTSAEQIRCLCHCIENFTYSKETKGKLRPPPHSFSLLLTPPHSSSLLLTPPHSSSLLLTPPHSSSLLLIPPQKRGSNGTYITTKRNINRFVFW